MNNPQFPVYRTTDPKTIDRIMRKINAHLRHCDRLPFPPHLNEDKNNLTRHLNNYCAFYLNSNHRWTAYRIAVVEKKNDIPTEVEYIFIGHYFTLYKTKYMYADSKIPDLWVVLHTR